MQTDRRRIDAGVEVDVVLCVVQWRLNCVWGLYSPTRPFSHYSLSASLLSYLLSFHQVSSLLTKLRLFSAVNFYLKCVHYSSSYIQHKIKIRKSNKCSYYAKCMLFGSYCLSLYDIALWHKIRWHFIGRQLIARQLNGDSLPGDN